MKTKEILTKSNKDLEKMLKTLALELSTARIDVSLKKNKNYRQIKSKKADIARIKTIIREKEIIEAEKSKGTGVAK